MKAILFDLDETIILDEAVSEEAFLAAAATVAAGRGSVDVALLARRAGGISRRLWAEGPYYDYCLRIGHSAWEGLWARYEYGEHQVIAALRDWAPGYRRRTWELALAEQGIADDDGALAKVAVARFMTARRSYPLYPEIPALLAALRERGYVLGIVTNGVPDLQREKLAGCGVSHWFQASVASGEIDCGKPEPGIFHHICRELEVEPAECIMVGDNPERDVAGAMAAGMRSVWVQRNGRLRDESFPGDLACTDLSAMLPWLEGLEA